MAENYVKAVEPLTGKEEGLGTGPTISPLVDTIKGSVKKMVDRYNSLPDWKTNQQVAKEEASKKTVKKAKGGSIKSASSRADGCAQRGKTKGRII